MKVLKHGGPAGMAFKRKAFQALQVLFLAVL
jgi:hypothetical protein